MLVVVVSIAEGQHTLIPWTSRRCLMILALPLDSYEKCDTVLHFLLTHSRQTHRSFLSLFASLMRNPFTHHQATLTPLVLGGVAARSSSPKSSNGNVAISDGVGFSSRLSIFLGGVLGAATDREAGQPELLDEHGEESNINDDPKPAWAVTRHSEPISIDILGDKQY